MDFAALVHPTPVSQVLMAASALIPLGFFALVALISPVEANWPAMYLIGAVPWVVRLLGGLSRLAALTALGNLALTTLLVLSAAQPAIGQGILGERFNRPWREIAGFAELADYAARLDGPVYADRYQPAARLRFYRPELTESSQWPGLERPSEYLRGRIAPRLEPE
ncbi:MAG: hypothetical protein N2690_12480, partial [Rhodocyclaceae bacterium]|nr:hypothetical protein [Rhodocyclaceae bacterium]